jgi:4-aminobutyrate aminotransferase-like enzyme
MVEPIGHTGYRRPAAGISANTPRGVRSIWCIADLRRNHHRRGATGHLFAAETFGVVPDVLWHGEGVCGSLCAVVSECIHRHDGLPTRSGDRSSRTPGFVEGHTFEGNPISCVPLVLPVLREIIERDLCGNARARGRRSLRAGFERLAKKYGVIGDIRGKGLLTRRRVGTRPRDQETILSRVQVRNACRPTLFGQRAVVPIRSKNWLAFGPPLITTSEQIGEMLDLLDKSVGEALA